LGLFKSVVVREMSLFVAAASSTNFVNGAFSWGLFKSIVVREMP